MIAAAALDPEPWEQITVRTNRAARALVAAPHAAVVVERCRRWLGAIRPSPVAAEPHRAALELRRATALLGPDWDGALHAALDSPTVGGQQIPMIVGPAHYSLRFGAGCSGSCVSGELYAVVDMQHMHRWQSGKCQLFGPA